ncbi:uncharacterized protein [Mytilus edulis]|uniref:uncharacterized protein isoform X1 n=2 Tax=Mytilus edulis TaxID=6550 RepID=UPI0039F09397
MINDYKCLLDPYQYEDIDEESDTEEDFSYFEEHGSVETLPKKRTMDDRHSERKGKMKILALDTLQVVFCCSVFCLSGVKVEDLAMARNLFQEKTKSERSQCIIDWIILSSNSRGSERQWIVGSKNVCLKAWRLTLGIPESTFYTIQKQVLDGKVTAEKSGRPLGSVEPKTLTALAWLQDFANSYAGFMPDSKQLHLPCCLTKSSVYSTMVSELEGPTSQCISLSHFLLVWRTELRHIAIPRRSRFSECNTCVLLKNEIESTRNKEVRKQLMQQRDTHLKQQKSEREKYYKHAMKARRNPDKYLSIIMDAMDQAKTMIPHFTATPKFADGMWKLKTHLLGAIVHGIGAYGFFDIFQWPHGSNLTVSTLMNILFMMKDSLPEVLYLQMDNCGRENKNRYLMSFLAFLVELKVFRKIKLSFLMVGHTHEDIDQMFSRFSIWLNHNSCKTMDSLMNGFQNCYNPKPTSIKTCQVYNYSEWITPYLAPMSGHSRHHVYKFKLENGKTKMVFKEWTTTKAWRECEGSDRYPLLRLPTTQPKLLQPNFQDLDKVENSILGARKYIDKEDMIWWERFFQEKHNEELEYEDDDSSFKLFELARFVAQRPLPDITTFSVPEIVVNRDVMPPVILGKKTKPAKSQPIIMEEGLKADDFVLTNLEKYSDEWPQIGKVISICGHNIHILWYKGSKSTSWSPCTMPISGQRGKREPFIETVTRDQIWKSGFQLTNNGYLPKSVKDAIDRY